MFGFMPSSDDKKAYCPQCGSQQSNSSGWQFNVGSQGWAHHHQDGSVHPVVRLTDAEYEERFPPSKIIQKDGGSCIIFDTGDRRK